MSKKALTALIAGLILVLTAAIAYAQGTGDYSSGEGIWHDDSGDKSVGWEVVGNEATGEADGEFDLRQNGTGDGFHADIVCIRVEGNEAFFELNTDDDAAEEFEVYAVDNVNGNGGPRDGDTFGLKPEDTVESTPLTDEDCEEDRNNDEDPIDGDIFNIDGDAKSRRSPSKGAAISRPFCASRACSRSG